MSEKKEILEKSKKLIEKYKLLPFSEGGYFAEIYTSSSSLIQNNDRPLAGSIYFLLDQKDITRFHRLDCEEIWYYHQEVGINIYFVEENNTISLRQLGIGEGQYPIVVVPKNTIYGAENIDTNGYTFISCITVPKFSSKCFEPFTKKKYPNLTINLKNFILLKTLKF